MKSLLPFLFLLLVANPALSQALDLVAPNPSFAYVNQKNGVGNSCGPTCLLNAFGSGSEPWRSCFSKILGESDRVRISSVIKVWGLKPSESIPNRKRWEYRGGVNFNDLAAMAVEMSQLNRSLSPPKSELFFANSEKESRKMLSNAHKRLAKSLKKGLPTILSVRRFVVRNGQWESVQGHFVVLVAMPSRLPRKSTAFPIVFRDPYGAKELQGTIALAQNDSQGLPCLALIAPESAIGKSSVKKGEASALGLTGAIGAW